MKISREKFQNNSLWTVRFEGEKYEIVSKQVMLDERLHKKVCDFFFNSLEKEKFLTKEAISWHACAYNAWKYMSICCKSFVYLRSTNLPATQLPELTPTLILIFSKGRWGMQNVDTPTNKSNDIKAISEACWWPIMCEI